MRAEWKTILGLGGIMLFLLFAFAAYSIWNNCGRKRRMLAKIRADWGAWPEREYDYYQWNALKGYFDNKKCETFQIDEITWDDLDLSRVFMQLNHTNSFMGEGYLYYLLHTPSFNEKELKERERLIQYFSEHDSQREKLQMFFCETGKTGQNSIFDAVYNLAEAVTVSNWHHFLMAGLFALSIIVLLLIPSPGILFLILAMFITMRDYYKYKRPVEKYIISCGYLLRTLQCAQNMGKLDAPEIREYQQRTVKAAKAFGKFKRNTFFLMAGSVTDDNILKGLLMYLNVCFHIDLIQFSTIVKEIKQHIGEFEILVEEMGKIESAIAIASYRQCMKEWCVPQLIKGETPKLSARELYHPLIREPVKNSVCAQRGVLLTGSNASGKSTFLKTVAINAILAQTVHTSLADHWESSYFRVFSSMALQDDLEGRESYYIVEIKSLKRILDAMGNPTPVLCFVDEVLRGTNTVERVAASSQVLKYMTDKSVLCFAATHDIELTHILEHYYDNYHFQEEVRDNDVVFDYHLYPGRAVSRNAIKLLSVMGYDREVIQAAEDAAADFLTTGEWKTVN